MDEEGDDDAGSIHSGDDGSHKEGSYRVIGTLKDPRAPVPEWLTQVVSVNFYICLIRLIIMCLEIYTYI